MSLIDTHAHIHFDQLTSRLDEVLDGARDNNITDIITVGTSLADSQNALAFVKNHGSAPVRLHATAGIHPHEAAISDEELVKYADFVALHHTDIVAIGECGLDYYRNEATSAQQKELLEFQIKLAIKYQLPLVFHVRDAWEDFFSIIGNYQQIRGVIHSFTGGPMQVEQAIGANLYFALNGIITFTKLDSQLKAAKLIPLDRLLLETDCPYLTPAPLRGKQNEPANVALVAGFLAKLRNLPLATLSDATSSNAHKLFSID